MKFLALRAWLEGATHLIADGTMISIDGHTGTVALVEADQPAITAETGLNG